MDNIQRYVKGMLKLVQWGWSQLSPLGAAATNRPIVKAPGDYDDGEIGGMIGRGNLPQYRFVHHKPHMLSGRETWPPLWEAND
jgi:hypothetical protein